MIEAERMGLNLPVRAVKSFLDLTKSCPVRIADMPVATIMGAAIAEVGPLVSIAGKKEAIVCQLYSNNFLFIKTLFAFCFVI